MVTGRLSQLRHFNFPSKYRVKLVCCNSEVYRPTICKFGGQNIRHSLRITYLGLEAEFVVPVTLSAYMLSYNEYFAYVYLGLTGIGKVF